MPIAITAGRPIPTRRFIAGDGPSRFAAPAGHARAAGRRRLRREAADGDAGRRSELAGAGEPLARILGQRPLHDVVERRRRARRQRRWRVVDVGEQSRRVARPLERGRPRQRVVEDAAQRVDVGADGRLVALHLLGRQVVGRPDHLAGLRQPRLRLGLGQAEVGQVDVLVRVEQDVARLDVAVDQPARVGGVERTGDAADDPHRPLGRQRTLARDQLQQIGPVDVAHRQVQRALELARLVHRDDVGVIEHRRQPRLTLEAGAEVIVVGVHGRDQLHRHRPLQAELGCPVDHPHAALAGESIDPVLARHDRAWRQLAHDSSLSGSWLRCDGDRGDPMERRRAAAARPAATAPRGGVAALRRRRGRGRGDRDAGRTRRAVDRNRRRLRAGARGRGRARRGGGRRAACGDPSDRGQLALGDRSHRRGGGRSGRGGGATAGARRARGADRRRPSARARRRRAVRRR